LARKGSAVQFAQRQDTFCHRVCFPSFSFYWR
jgi:hypothetical protein